MKVSVEKSARRISGFPMLLVQFGILAVIGLLIYQLAEHGPSPAKVSALIATIIAAILMLPGFFVVQPNHARALVFFGVYVGSVREAGFWWANPFAIKRDLSLRVRNFNSDRLKVNDAGGNPIEIAAVIVWKVFDTSKALFDVDDYEEFVSIQSETALRGLASRFPYDSHDDPDDITLRGHQDKVATTLKEEVEQRLGVAGVDVIEARLSHLAYSPEIAQAMLRRQQAQAIIAARKQIVEGAVGMVQMALAELSKHKVVELDEERKANMVNNLLVVLTSEQQSQPVLNAGTLY